jgi:hypothetical protein
MKTKTLITTVALTGALLASASVAKANAFLELISGTSTTSIASGSDSVAGAFTVGGWTANVTSGTSFGFGTILSVTESTSSFGNSPANGLTILYSSGAYSQDGPYTFSGTENASTVGATVALYFGSVVADVTTSIPGGLGALAGGPYTLAGSGGGSVASPTGTGTTTGTFVVNELMTIGGGAGATLTGAGTRANVQDTFVVKGIIPNVPDGGTTLTMFGSAMLALAGLRSKFGKRS